MSEHIKKRNKSIKINWMERKIRYVMRLKEVIAMLQ